MRTEVTVETFSARWLHFCSTRHEQHLRRHVRINRWHKKTVATVPALLKKMAIGTWHMNRFLAILGRPSLSNFFLAGPVRLFFSMDHNDFYLNVLLPLIFTWTFMLHCLKGQTRAIPVQIHCQYAGGAGATGPWLPARPNPPDIWNLVSMLYSTFSGYIPP